MMTFSSQLSVSSGDQATVNETDHHGPVPEVWDIKVFDDPGYCDTVTSNTSSEALLALEKGIDTEKASHDEMSRKINLLENPSFIVSPQHHSPQPTRLAQACQNAISHVTLMGDQVSQSLLSLNKCDKFPTVKMTLNIPGKTQYRERDFLKNLIVLSVGIMLCSTAYDSLRNLQSSLNHKDGLGLTSLACAFGSFMVGNLFAPYVVKKIHPKRAVLLSFLVAMLYIASNIHPLAYLLLPISVISGFTFAMTWNSVSTYITFIARDCATAVGKPVTHITSKFYGIFFLIWYMSAILGNLVSSLVFMFGNAHEETPAHRNASGYGGWSIHDNTSSSAHGKTSFMDDNLAFNESHEDYYHLCGAKYCHSYTIAFIAVTVSGFTKYLLIGIYIAVVVVAFAVIFFFLEHLKMSSIQKTDCMEPLRQVGAVLKLFCDARFLLLVPLMMYSNMQYANVTAEVTKSFVTCPLGIHMVGYVLICYGVMDAISAYVSGLVMKFTGRIALICLGGIINLILIGGMFSWQPHPSDGLVPYFVLLGGWGLADGIWASQLNSLFSTIFTEKCEETFAAFRLVQAFGVTLMYVYAQSLCMDIKLYILVCLCIISMAGYILLEIKLKRDDKKTISELSV